MNKYIPISKPSITQLEKKLVNEVIDSGWVSSLGKYIDMFEERFADFCGTKFAIATSNGTSALHLALLCLGVTAGDEVIIPDLTFIATANAVTYTGAKPVIVDVEETSLCLDPNKIEEAVTPNTKAILPVHLYGHPANMVEITRIAKDFDLFVIEDSAEAHGAMVHDRKTGSLGDCGVFSFYGNKILTCGEGGMITTNNEDFYYKAKYLRDHAMSNSKKYWHDQLGFNYRMTNMQAALGIAQLDRVYELISRKKEIYQTYQRNLEGIPELKLNFNADWAKSVYWLICLEIEGFTEKKRDRLQAELKQMGIDSRPYFYPVSQMPMYRCQKNNTPVAHKVYQKGICLPSYFDLENEDITYICDSVKKALKAI